MRGKRPSTMRETEFGAYPRFGFLIRHGRQAARKHSLLVIVVGFVFATLAQVGSAAPPPAAPGSYELKFLKSTVNGFVEVTTLPVCTTSQCDELILNAHITNENTGLPAQSGLVSFQYCSYKGLPPNDISRPDEAPMEACADGSATWKSLAGLLKVDQSGDAYFDFGIVLIPRTVGFRYIYKGQGSVANGMGGPKNFTWTAQ